MIKLKKLINENRLMIMDYMEHLGPYIQQLRPNIRGWKFQVDNMAGSWEWYNNKFDTTIYATWGWEGKNEIPLETSEGDAWKPAKLKLKASEPEDEKNLKRDAKKYLDIMKKELPEIADKI